MRVVVSLCDSIVSDQGAVLLLEKLDKYAFQTPLDTGPKPGAPVWGKEEGGGGLVGLPGVA